MIVDCLKYKRITYEALLKIASFENGKIRVREYITEPSYCFIDGKPKRDEIVVYTYNAQFKYVGIQEKPYWRVIQ